MDEKYFIGTSGWSYKHWKGRFYPDNVPQRKWLEYYTEHFNTVELNASFYRLPSEGTVKNWYKRTPEGFKFTVKGSRVVTHLKKLKDCKEQLDLFYGVFKFLEEKLAIVLYQLPPSLHYEPAVLKDFLKVLPADISHVFEFRHSSWFNEDTWKILGDYGAHFCVSDYPGKEAPRTCVGDLAYLRFHGYKKRYGGEYPSEYLADAGKLICHWVAEDKKVFAYFNNDAEGFAVKNAKELQEICRKELKGRLHCSFQCSPER